MSAAVVKFFDRGQRPPRGGWSYPIGGELVTTYSEGEIMEAVAKWKRNNNQFVSMLQVESEVWAYYCRREPTRCPGFSTAVVVDGETLPGPINPAEKTPELQGPPIWTFLNTLAAQWSPPLHNYFLETVNAIAVILDCPVCQAEWRSIVQASPPNALNSRVAVCQWVNRAHNVVNAKKGKATFPYWKMVQQFGAPLP